STTTLVGYQAGYEIKTAASNTFIGYQAGRSIEGSGSNVAVGKGALYASGANNNTVENVAVGYEALYNVTEFGAENTAVGYKALRSTTEGGEEINSANTAVGWLAGGDIGADSIENVFMGVSAGEGAGETGKVDGNVFVGYQAGQEINTGDYNIAIGYMAGEGWLDTESNLLVVDNTDTATPLIYGDFSADNISINGDFSVLMDVALDQVLIWQAATAGTEDQPLIFINDDRTGTTVSEKSEATLYIETVANRAILITGGYGIELDGGAGLTSSGEIYAEGHLWWGVRVDSIWDSNGVEDSLWTMRLANHSAADSSALFFSKLDVTGTTDFNDWTSPSIVLANNNGADGNDYAGVVMGERAQADVKVAHYFDFYAMTGSADGSPTADELPAIFRFGPNGTGVPSTYANTPGDVLFEGNTQVDGNSFVEGYNRTLTLYWQESFDHGRDVEKYDKSWDITDLNTQGNGTNTIETTPSRITLTTDNNA
ncbi:unnamed protein product, partial [marine sediment metagenome]